MSSAVFTPITNKSNSSYSQAYRGALLSNYHYYETGCNTYYIFSCSNCDKLL